MLSINHRILGCILSRPMSGEGEKLLHKQMDRVENRDKLIRLAVQHGLIGLFYRNLMDSDLIDFFSASQKKMMESHYYRIAAANVRSIENLGEVLSHCRMKEIQVVLIQGVPLLLEIYRDLGLRPMLDLDLWINAEDMAAFRSVLHGLGYQADRVYPGTFRRQLVTLDIHTHPLGADRIRSRRNLLAEDSKNLRRRCRKVSVDTESAWVLDGMDQFICLSLHALKHRVNRWIWLADILNLCMKWSASDWLEIAARAETAGQMKGLGYIFLALKEIGEFPVSGRIDKFLETITFTRLERMAFNQFDSDGALPEWMPLMLVSSKASLYGRLSYYVEHLFPREEVLNQVFTCSRNASFIKLYGRRIAQLLKMGVGSLVR